MTYENLRSDFVEEQEDGSVKLWDSILYMSDEMNSYSDGEVPVFHIREETIDGRPIYAVNVNIDGDRGYLSERIDRDSTGFGSDEKAQVEQFVQNLREFYDDFDYELPDNFIDDI